MAAYTESIQHQGCGKRGFAKWAKRQMNKLFRRQAKANPEDAPKKPITRYIR